MTLCRKPRRFNVHKHIAHDVKPLEDEILNVMSDGMAAVNGQVLSMAKTSSVVSIDELTKDSWISECELEFNDGLICDGCMANGFNPGDNARDSHQNGLSQSQLDFSIMLHVGIGDAIRRGSVRQRLCHFQESRRS